MLKETSVELTDSDMRLYCLRERGLKATANIASSMVPQCGLSSPAIGTMQSVSHIPLVNLGFTHLEPRW